MSGPNIAQAPLVGLTGEMHSLHSDVNMTHDSCVTTVSGPLGREGGRAGDNNNDALLLLALIEQTFSTSPKNNKAVNLVAIKTDSCWEVILAYNNCLSC